LRQTEHVREASTGPQQAHVRRPGSLRGDFLTKDMVEPYPWPSEGWAGGKQALLVKGADLWLPATGLLLGLGWVILTARRWLRRS
jgi:hypothetical protein